MQENNSTLERDSRLDNMKAQCSCTECDSSSCFAMRQVEQMCTCGTCKSSTSCLFRNNNLDNTSLCANDIKNLAVEFAVENLAREIVKKQIIYELTSSNNEQVIKKQSRLTYKTSNTNDSENLGNEYTITASSKTPSLLKGKESDRVVNMRACKKCKDPKKCKVISVKASVVSSELEKQSDSAVPANIFIEQVCSSHAKLKDSKVGIQCVNSQKDNIYTIRDTDSTLNKLDRDTTNEFKETNPSIGKISAELMNIHYKHSQKMVAKPSDISSIVSIIKKIKDAYKACSCRVCECIVGKSCENELCKCKPCECSDCASFSAKRANSISGRLFPMIQDKYSSAVCVKNRRSISEKRGLGCDSLGVLKNNNLYSSACTCEPCHCIECRTRFINIQGLVVAPVVGENQNRVCDCSPCECGECVPALYGPSSNSRNEMSTSVNRHPQCQCEMCADEACVPDGNQSCRCERQSRVMRKPFQQTSHDYDIRRSNVTFNNETQKNTRDTIAMYASVMKSNPYQTHNVDKCYCDQCECSHGKHNTHKVSTDAYSKLSASAAFQCLDLKQMNNDLKNCTKLNSLAQIYYGSKKSKSKFSAKGISQSECSDCKNQTSVDIENKHTSSNSKIVNCAKQTCSDEFVYPVKKGELLTPAIFKRKIHDAFIESCTNTAVNGTISKQLGILKSSLRKPSKIKTSYKPTFQEIDKDSQSQKNSIQDTRTANSMFHSNDFSQNESVKLAEQSKYCYEMHMDKNTENSNLNSSISKHNENLPPSSCRDHASYQVHLPKTVETYLAMQLRTARNINQMTQHSKKFGNHVQNSFEKQLTKLFSTYEPSPYDKPNGIHTYFTQHDTLNPHSVRTSPTNSDSNVKSTKYDNKKKYLDNMSSNTDYERIKNTLAQSRAFSSQLLQLLKKYEKANREFESVSKKLTKPNSVIQNEIESNINAVEMDVIPTKDLKTCSKIITVKENKYMKKSNMLRFLSAFKSSDDGNREMVSKIKRTSACNHTNEELHENGDVPCRINNTNLKTLLEEKESIDQSYDKHDETKNVAKSLDKKPIISSKENNCTGKNISGVHEANESDNILNKADRETILKVKNINTERNHKHLDEVAEVAGLQGHINKSIKDIRDPNSEPTTVEPSKEIIKKIDDPWPILKKNFCITNKLCCRSEILATPLEENVKTVGNAISNQPINENATYMYKNKALIKLYSEVKKLVDLPTLQLQTLECNARDKKALKHDIMLNKLSSATSSQTTIEDIYGKQSTSHTKAALSSKLSSKNSCDALKVSYVTVRQVSNHSILVKWSTPLALGNVEGYELLVDGKAVKKILGPKRCMAVVTCLHSAKVLLTVRTVMTLPCPDHCPAVTVIYHPKFK